MSDKLLRVIPAAPGFRVAELHGDGPENAEMHFEPVIAWGVLATEPDRLVPLVVDGDGVGWKYSRENESEEPCYFDLLKPGEDLDPSEDGCRQKIAFWFEMAEEMWKRRNERIAKEQKERARRRTGLQAIGPRRS